MEPVDDGNINVTPTETTTYTGIIVGSGGTTTCDSVTITVTE